MSEQSNVQLVQQAYAAFGRADIDGVLQTLSENVDWFIPGPTDIIPVRRQKTWAAGGRGVLRDPCVDADRGTVRAARVHRQRRQGRGDGKITKFTEYHDTAAEAAAHRR
ncbi:nuclear transport factor 2 family protein (plasmid) [Paraburkholderia strydomiana]